MDGKLHTAANLRPDGFRELPLHRQSGLCLRLRQKGGQIGLAVSGRRDGREVQEERGVTVGRGSGSEVDGVRDAFELRSGRRLVETLERTETQIACGGQVLPVLPVEYIEGKQTIAVARNTLIPEGKEVLIDRRQSQ